MLLLTKSRALTHLLFKRLAPPLSGCAAGRPAERRFLSDVGRAARAALSDESLSRRALIFIALPIVRTAGRTT